MPVDYKRYFGWKRETLIQYCRRMAVVFGQTHPQQTGEHLQNLMTKCKCRSLHQELFDMLSRRWVPDTIDHQGAKLACDVRYRAGRFVAHHWAPSTILELEH
jgi:hypothetical protein